MPEIIEIEIYRRLAERLVGRRVGAVTALADGYLRGGAAPSALTELAGAEVHAARRIGKLLVLDVGTATLGLRFGMTGRLVIDGDHAIDALLYTTAAANDAHLRFGLAVGDGSLEIVDPRRFGSVELGPDEAALGADAWQLSSREAEEALVGGRGALKSRLLDQARIAGLGNLLCDEILWRCGLAPDRVAGDLAATEVDALARTVRATIDELDRRGGSHMGDLQDQRHSSGVCPVDGEPLRHATIGGRSTYWCPEHQH